MMIPFGESELREAGMLEDRGHWDERRIIDPYNSMDGIDALALTIIVVAMACPVIIGLELVGVIIWLAWKLWAG